MLNVSEKPNNIWPVQGILDIWVNVVQDKLMFIWDFLWFLVLGVLRNLLPHESTASSGWSSFYIIKCRGQIYVSSAAERFISLIFLVWLLLDQNIFFHNCFKSCTKSYKKNVFKNSQAINLTSIPTYTCLSFTAEKASVQLQLYLEND